MIIPPGFRGAAFGSAADGDGRSDPVARATISGELGIADDWASLRQIHGAVAVIAETAGMQGEGDALVTDRPALPLVVATADCFPIVLESEAGTAIAHAGWRGVVAGVVPAARAALERFGAPVDRVAVGPGIGPCCFEVGDEVSERFDARFRARTRWGTASVDLAGAVSDQVAGLAVWGADACTMCGDGFHSFRRDATPHRQIGVTWLPSD